MELRSDQEQTKYIVNFINLLAVFVNDVVVSLNMPRITTATKFVNFASDATESQLAAVEMNNLNNQIVIFNSLNNILVNELKAALLALDLALERATSLKDPSAFCARIYIDNRAVIALINRGRARWDDATIGIFALFNIELFRELFSFTAIYIPSSGNPTELYLKTN